MQVLLDTHSFLWFIDGNPNLSNTARLLIENEDNQPFLSVASLWEMAIKVSLGKLILSQPFDSLIPQQLKTNGIDISDIKFAHLSRVSTLPFHHRDPFDRLIIAQALEEELPIISGDKAFDAYNIERLW